MEVELNKTTMQDKSIAQHACEAQKAFASPIARANIVYCRKSFVVSTLVPTRCNFYNTLLLLVH